MRTALDRARERKALGSSATPIGDNGGRGAPRNYLQARRAKRLVLGSSKRGRGEASRRSNGCRLSAVWEAEGCKCDRRKKEGVTRNHGFPYRKEGRDSLPGSTEETPQSRKLPALGVSMTGNLMIKG